MPVEKEKYCLGNCGTILNDPCSQPHKKYCKNCKSARDVARCLKSQDKHREKYNEHRKQKYKEAKIHA